MDNSSERRSCFADVQRLPSEIPARCPTRTETQLEGEILAVFDRPPIPGEQIEAAFRRKEHELGSLFSRLSVADSRSLHHRLASPQASDPVATRFAGLVAERRGRLLAFLADARRREALRRAW